MLADLYKTLNSPLEPIPTTLEPKLTKLDNIRAVIFDIYGTLVLSGTGDISIAQTINRESELQSILSGFGFNGLSEGSLSDHFYALIQEDHAKAKSKGIEYPEVDILEIWSRFFEATTSSVPPGSIIQEIAIRFECAVNPVWPAPHLIEMLSGLQERSLPAGIVSNAQFYTPLMVEGFTEVSLPDLGFQEELCVWSYVERLGKPSVELFKKLSKALVKRGIAPDQALYVGNDLLNDIWTAKEAGLRTVLFAGDQRSLRLRENDERCADLIPDAIITNLMQIESII